MWVHVYTCGCMCGCVSVAIHGKGHGRSHRTCMVTLKSLVTAKVNWHQQKVVGRLQAWDHSKWHGGTLSSSVCHCNRGDCK